MQFDRYLLKTQRKEFLPNSAVLPVRSKTNPFPECKNLRRAFGTIRHLFGNVGMTSLHQLRTM